MFEVNSLFPRGMSMGGASAAARLLIELPHPFRGQGLGIGEQGSLGSGGSSLPELLNASQNTDLRKNVETAEVVSGQKQKASFTARKWRW